MSSIGVHAARLSPWISISRVHLSEPGKESLVARLCGLQIVLVNKKQYCQTDGVKWKGAIACEMSTLLQQPCTLSSQWWHQVGSHAALV